MKVTAEPLAFGSSTPTVSPGGEMSAILRASTATPMRNMRRRQGAAERVLNRCAPEAVRFRLVLEGGEQRASEVRGPKDELRHDVVKPGAGGPAPGASGEIRSDLDPLAAAGS